MAPQGKWNVSQSCKIGDGIGHMGAFVYRVYSWHDVIATYVVAGYTAATPTVPRTVYLLMQAGRLRVASSYEPPPGCVQAYQADEITGFPGVYSTASVNDGGIPLLTCRCGRRVLGDLGQIQIRMAAVSTLAPQITRWHAAREGPCNASQGSIASCSQSANHSWTP